MFNRITLLLALFLLASPALTAPLVPHLAPSINISVHKHHRGDDAVLQKREPKGAGKITGNSESSLHRMTTCSCLTI
jgi:hypothetical protein